MTKVTPIGDAKKKRKPDPGWREELRASKNGVPKNTLGNVDLILRHDEKYSGRFAFNEMAATPELDGKPLVDADFTRIRVEIEREYMMAPSEDNVVKAIGLVAAERAYHPVRAYLQSLAWDGESRIDQLVGHVLRAEATALHVSYVRRWFLAMVARAFAPGSKVDTALVLQGPQGAGKSTFFRALTEPYFTDTDIDLQSKDAYIVLGASWCLEWGELDALSRASRERVKAFLSSVEDAFRQPYGRGVVRVKRTAVVVGSTNEQVFLRDPTGSRRFWILPVSGVDIAYVQEHRDQLWAEAVAAYQAGEEWWLSDAEDTEREKKSDDFKEEDAWKGDVLAWATGKAAFTMTEVLEHALKIPLKDMGKSEEARVSAILRAAGYERGAQQRVDGERVRKWAKRATAAVGDGR